jgi:hypothetical protein
MKHGENEIVTQMKGKVLEIKGKHFQKFQYSYMIQFNGDMFFHFSISS